MKLQLLDLFSGIGGFSLGLERSGFFETVAFCEIEPFPRRVLAKHWPKVPQYHDVRELTAARLAADGIAVDAICGGFPCQDISTAGKGAGIDGERSGLWRQIARLAGELRPRVIVLENVAALLGRGLDRVLGDLAKIGYDAEWHCISAASIGALHIRDRIWIVAYPFNRRRDGPDNSSTSGYNCEWHVASSERKGPTIAGEIIASREVLADAHGPRLSIGQLFSHVQGTSQFIKKGKNSSLGGWWFAEPDVGRVAHGIPQRVDRLKGLGNAVVPQVVELIGRAIGEAMGLAA